MCTLLVYVDDAERPQGGRAIPPRVHGRLQRPLRRRPARGVRRASVASRRLRGATAVVSEAPDGTVTIRVNGTRLPVRLANPKLTGRDKRRVRTALVCFDIPRSQAPYAPRGLSGRPSVELSVTIRHAQRAGALPGTHRDPFDRMLIAQAQLESLTVVSRDNVFDGYGVSRLWS